MPLVPILESKFQNGTQICKSLKLVHFFVRTYQVCPFWLEGVSRVNSSKFWFSFSKIFYFIYFL